MNSNQSTRRHLYVITLLMVGVLLIPNVEAALTHSYDFETGSGTTLFDTTGSNDFTLTSMGWNTTEYPTYNITGDGASYSGYFDGSVDNGSSNTALITHDVDHSICNWFYVSAGGGSNYYLSQMDDTDRYKQDFLIKIESGQLEYMKRTANATANADYVNYAVSDDTWTHMCFVYNESVGDTGGDYNQGAMSLYVDGILRDDTITDDNVAGWAMTEEVRIGSAVGSVEYQGNLDELHVYDHALTVDEVKNIYNCGVAGGCAPDIKYATITVRDSYDNNTINGLTVWIGTDSNTTVGGSATIYNFTGLNYTVDGGDGYFNLSGTATENSTITVDTYHGLTNFTATDTNGDSISYPYDVTLGPTQTITDATTRIYIPYNTSYMPYFNDSSWYLTAGTNTTSLTKGNTTTSITNVANGYIDFIGSTSQEDYSGTVLCALNGTYLTRHNTNYYTILDNNTLVCDEGSQYPAFNETLTINEFPFTYNQSEQTQINVTEYSLALYFDDNVTGNVTWTHDTDFSSRGQFPLESDEGYNTTTFSFIKIKANWSDDTLVNVMFNPKLGGVYNSSAQYYVYRNDITVSTVENITVLDKLDGIAWMKVQNYGQEDLIEATVRVFYCAAVIGNECNITTQILTQPQSGAASPGTPLYLDTDLNYWVHISKTGYQPEALIINGRDLIDDETLVIKMKPLFTNINHDYLLHGPTTHNNQSNLHYYVGHINGGTFHYNTSYSTSPQSTSFTNGGKVLTLTRGTHYANNTDFTLHIMSYDTITGEYTIQRSINVRYEERDYRSILDKIQTNSTLRVFLWIFLIGIASFLGNYIKKDDLDTGYYIFAGGSFILAMISTMFVPVAAVIGVLLLGGAAFSVSRE